MAVEHISSGVFGRGRVRVPMSRFFPMRSRLLPPKRPSTSRSVPPPTQAAASHASDYTARGPAVDLHGCNLTRGDLTGADLGPASPVAWSKHPRRHPVFFGPGRRSLRLPGGAKENRTPDLFHAMEALYQLSYSPGESVSLRDHPAALPMTQGWPSWARHVRRMRRNWPPPNSISVVTARLG